ncbi:hypothetical protein Lalb_Chr07g0187451 [Lupinus albus]|uniref:Uncharacterized protein n=1 Tax=Lupinus albus TaxID=3870 RepID=A0A6A4Q9B4_LUPAL|nr:hypothetical protein Lalb_Chr07g0187451 [Lupinus albus]
MVKYSREPDNSTKSCKARGADLRVHFKLHYYMYVKFVGILRSWDYVGKIE